MKNRNVRARERRFHLAVGMLMCLACSRADGAKLRVEVVSALVQVFPTHAPDGSPAAHLEAARGEWEAFQIVVHGPARGVSAVAGTLRSARGASLAAPRLYRVGYLDVTTPSSIEGRTGPWPDPLIPDVDAYVGEKRNAFPFDVPKGELRAIWVEHFVPAGSPPGEYRGAVTVRADRETAEVPVELLVRRFTLPKTSSIPVTFGIGAAAVYKGHRLDRDDAALFRRYGVAALRHRISLHAGTMTPAPWKVRKDGEVDVDFAPYDAEVGPFLDGTADPGGPADGARFTAIDLRVPVKLPTPARDRYTRAVVDHFRARGWLDRLFAYVADEPKNELLPEVRAKADHLHAVAPEVPRLVTRELSPGLAGAVDIWCPAMYRFDDKPESGDKWPPRPAYEPRRRAGEKIWWYQACMSHGCDIVGGSYFTGWPSYAIDAPAVSHRIFEWLTFRYRLGGELYYMTVTAYEAGLDPWRDQHQHGGNGDGTLFYPGRPEVIGGKTDVPVESIRLKLIRDGLEDYEYLRLHAERYGFAATDAIAAGIAARSFEWAHDPARLYQARHRLAEEIDAPAN